MIFPSAPVRSSVRKRGEPSVEGVECKTGTSALLDDFYAVLCGEHAGPRYACLPRSVSSRRFSGRFERHCQQKVIRSGAARSRAATTLVVLAGSGRGSLGFLSGRRQAIGHEHETLLGAALAFDWPRLQRFRFRSIYGSAQAPTDSSDNGRAAGAGLLVSLGARWSPVRERSGRGRGKSNAHGHRLMATIATTDRELVGTPWSAEHCRGEGAKEGRQATRNSCSRSSRTDDVEVAQTGFPRRADVSPGVTEGLAGTQDGRAWDVRFARNIRICILLS